MPKNDTLDSKNDQVQPMDVDTTPQATEEAAQVEKIKGMIEKTRYLGKVISTFNDESQQAYYQALVKISNFNIKNFIVNLDKHASLFLLQDTLRQALEENYFKEQLLSPLAFAQKLSDLPANEAKDELTKVSGFYKKYSEGRNKVKKDIKSFKYDSEEGYKKDHVQASRQLKNDVAALEAFQKNASDAKNDLQALEKALAEDVERVQRHQHDLENDVAGAAPKLATQSKFGAKTINKLAKLSGEELSNRIAELAKSQVKMPKQPSAERLDVARGESLNKAAVQKLVTEGKNLQQRLMAKLALAKGFTQAEFEALSRVDKVQRLVSNTDITADDLGSLFENALILTDKDAKTEVSNAVKADLNKVIEAKNALEANIKALEEKKELTPEDTQLLAESKKALATLSNVVEANQKSISLLEKLFALDMNKLIERNHQLFTQPDDVKRHLSITVPSPLETMRQLDRNTETALKELPEQINAQYKVLKAFQKGLKEALEEQRGPKAEQTEQVAARVKTQAEVYLEKKAQSRKDKLDAKKTAWFSRGDNRRTASEVPVHVRQDLQSAGLEDAAKGVFSENYTQWSEGEYEAYDSAAKARADFLARKTQEGPNNKASVQGAVDAHQQRVAKIRHGETLRPSGQVDADLMEKWLAHKAGNERRKAEKIKLDYPTVSFRPGAKPAEIDAKRAILGSKPAQAVAHAFGKRVSQEGKLINRVKVEEYANGYDKTTDKASGEVFAGLPQDAAALAQRDLQGAREAKVKAKADALFERSQAAVDSFKPKTKI